MDQVFEFTREQLTEAFKKWNAEVAENPELFEEKEDHQQAAEEQAGYLLEKLNQATIFDSQKKYMDSTNEREKYATLIAEKIRDKKGFDRTSTIMVILHDFEDEVLRKNAVLQNVNRSCPLCHGYGEYTTGGSFGGPVTVHKCDCGAITR